MRPTLFGALKRSRIFYSDQRRSTVRTWRRRFNDDGAVVQKSVAERLVDWAHVLHPPRRVIDLGCGTGFVSRAVRRRWPDASLTALDQSATMLCEAVRHVPGILTEREDASSFLPSQFDAVFSSMALQWMAAPGEGLEPLGWSVVPGCPAFRLRCRPKTAFRNGVGSVARRVSRMRFGSYRSPQLRMG